MGTGDPQTRRDSEERQNWASRRANLRILTEPTIVRMARSASLSTSVLSVLAQGFEECIGNFYVRQGLHDSLNQAGTTSVQFVRHVFNGLSILRTLAV